MGWQGQADYPRDHNPSTERRLIELTQGVTGLASAVVDLATRLERIEDRLQDLEQSTRRATAQASDANRLAQTALSSARGTAY